MNGCRRRFHGRCIDMLCTWKACVAFFGVSSNFFPLNPVCRHGIFQERCFAPAKYDTIFSFPFVGLRTSCV